MATATATTVEIQPAVPAVTEKVITLTLTEREAKLFLALSGSVEAEGPFRQVERELWLALRSVGMVLNCDWFQARHQLGLPHRMNNVSFKARS